MKTSKVREKNKEQEWKDENKEIVRREAAKVKLSKQNEFM